jgi:Protein of unknown function (DUF1997)
VLNSSLAERLAENRFRLTFSRLEELVPILKSVKPQFVLSVEPDSTRSRVLFVVNDVKWGNAMLDKSIVSMASVLSREQVGQQAVLVAALQYTMAVPVNRNGAARLIPIRPVEAIAQRIATSLLVLVAKDFLGALVKDYENWAAGRPRRQITLQGLTDPVDALPAGPNRTTSSV